MNFALKHAAHVKVSGAGKLVQQQFVELMALGCTYRKKIHIV